MRWLPCGHFGRRVHDRLDQDLLGQRRLPGHARTVAISFADAIADAKPVTDALPVAISHPGAVDQEVLLVGLG